MKPTKHATVRIGEYVIPLIGVPETATQEKCSRCRKQIHLADAALSESGDVLCQSCAETQAAWDDFPPGGHHP